MTLELTPEQRAELERIATDQPKPADPITAAQELGALLKLDTVGLTIRGARIVGRGSRASADLYLSDGTEITFEALRDVANPSRLAVEIAACTGATPALKQPMALRALTLLRALAEHHAATTIDELSIDLGTTYLQTVAALPVDLNDQADRWRAFAELERLDPVQRSRADAVSIAQASIVLEHTDGTRLVRTGWFRAYAKQEDPAASPEEIAHRMQRVGWQRRGGSGRIKATRPGHAGSLVWTFYTVPPAWELGERK